MGTKSNVKEISVEKKAGFKHRGKICGVLILLIIVLVGTGIFAQYSDIKITTMNNMNSMYTRQLEVYQKLESTSIDIAADALVSAYKVNPIEYVKNLNKNKVSRIEGLKKELSESEISLMDELERTYSSYLDNEQSNKYSEMTQLEQFGDGLDRELREEQVKHINDCLKVVLKDDKVKLEAINNVNESFAKRAIEMKTSYEKKITDIEKLFDIAMNIEKKEGNIARKTDVGIQLMSSGKTVFMDDIYKKNQEVFNDFYTGSYDRYRDGIYDGIIIFDSNPDKKSPFVAYGNHIYEEINSGVYFENVVQALEMVGYNRDKVSLSLNINDESLKVGIFEELYKNHVQHTKQEYSYLNNISWYLIGFSIIGFILGLIFYKSFVFKWYRKIPCGLVVNGVVLVYGTLMTSAYYGFSHYLLLPSIAFVISDIRFISKFGIRERFEAEYKILNSKIIKKLKGRDFSVKDININKSKLKNMKFEKLKIFYARYDVIINWLLFILTLFMIAGAFYASGYFNGFVVFGVIGCGVILVVGFVLMLLKNQSLKLEIEEIELATKKIIEGDFDIKFSESKISSLNNIRENLVGIDKGFKIAIEDELKSERMKAELITNVSHDLKTPLTSIISYVDLLQKEGLDESEKKAYIKILDHKSKRLKVLIEDLFEASKAATGNIKLNIETIDINSVLRQTVAEFKEKIDESKLDFKITMPEHKVFLNLDGARTWRVFENLIGNALKYSMERTRVYVELRDYEDKVVFEIKNISGYELNCNPQELKERFKRADESRNTEGSGLGLAIANSLVEIQGGKLDIAIDGDLFKVKIIFEK
ncbi:MAG: sensor histidine kinase [Sarcina sp.]